MKSFGISILSDSEELSRRFGAENHSRFFKPKWNIQAEQLVPVVRRRSINDQPTLDMLSWGCSSNACEPSSKELFSTALEYMQPIYDSNFYRRCLVAATTLFVIDKNNDKLSSTFSFAMRYPETAAIAAIWAVSKEEGRRKNDCFFLLNAQDVHNTSYFEPVIVYSSCWGAWLGKDSGDISSVISRYTYPRPRPDVYLPKICQRY